MSHIDFGGGSYEALVCIALAFFTFGAVYLILLAKQTARPTSYLLYFISVGSASLVLWTASLFPSYFFALNFKKEGIVVKRAFFLKDVDIRTLEIEAIEMVHYHYTIRRHGDEERVNSWEFHITLTDGGHYESAKRIEPRLAQIAYQAAREFWKRPPLLFIVDTPRGEREPLQGEGHCGAW